MKVRKFLSALLLLGTLGVAGLPASAQTLVSGTVHQIDNHGVYILNNGTITFVPSSATFRRGSVVYTPGDLGVGMDVVATGNPTYTSEYIPVQFYSAHPDWDWPHQVTGWQRERVYWHFENGQWRR